jgi:hypothetical protein
MTATQRGEYVRDACNAILDELIADGILSAGRRDDAIVVMWSRLADYMYPDNKAIEVPTLRRAPYRPVTP